MMSPHREEAVWKRVMETAAEAPAVQPGLTAQTVLQQWQQERQGVHSYQALAQGKRPVVSQMLRRLAAQEQEHAATLEAVYYLMTGRRPQSGPLQPGPQTLRECWLHTREAEKTYGRLARQGGPFVQTMDQLSRSHGRQGEELLALIAKSL